MDKKVIQANVIMSKCRHSKAPFGIRIEQREDTVWYCTWAFKISEKKASGEGYMNNKISGQVEFDSGYPGCPHCGGNGWVKCGKCGRLACWGTDAAKFTCPWCGMSSGTRTADRFDLQGGGY